MPAHRAAAPPPPAEAPAVDAAQLIPLAKVPQLKWMPTRRRRKRLALSTVYRWSGPGVRGVKLRTVCVGGCRCTTKDWLWAFFNALAGGPAAADRPATPAAGRRDHDRAERELDAARV